jgi:hypothetical protein
MAIDDTGPPVDANAIRHFPPFFPGGDRRAAARIARPAIGLQSSCKWFAATFKRTQRPLSNIIFQLCRIRILASPIRQPNFNSNRSRGTFPHIILPTTPLERLPINSAQLTNCQIFFYSHFGGKEG